MRDAGLVKSPFGARVLAIGALSEFGPIVATSLLLTTAPPDVARAASSKLEAVGFGFLVPAGRAGHFAR
ncbi:MAG TPA: hypothetical protein VFC19_42635 [Candidatus Limnocylindrales bacterium]|nr:hypothetical protein [Candidatus Limnocylindrales bacterium]